MKHANAFSLILLSVAALASCEPTPLVRANSQDTISIKAEEAACESVKIDLLRNGSQTVNVISNGPMSVSLVALVHADAWNGRESLAIEAEPNSELCSADLSVDTTMDCKQFALNSLKRLTIKASNQSVASSGFTVTLWFY